MIRTFALAFLLLAGTPTFAAEPPPPIKPGPGLDVVAEKCSICHTLAYVRMNSTFLTPDGWTAEVAKMRGVFGAPVDDEEAAQILRYLQAQYGVAPKS